VDIWIDYLGKFHPVVLHLPIGALLFTFLLALFGFKEVKPFRLPIKIGIIFSFFSAFASSILGYLLYDSGGYDADSVQRHLILGWSTTACIGLLWILFERVTYRTIFLPFFVVSISVLTLTGHYGGQITHGQEYLALPVAPEKEDLIDTDSIQLYNQAIAKVFDKKCVSCHNFSKRKGGLALHQPAAILEGGESGMPYETGNSTKSRIITYADLPLEDDLHMPPQGRPQLTPSEIKLLAYWIDQGAAFEGTASLERFPEEVQQSFAQFLPKALPEVEPLSVKTLVKLQENGFRLTSYTADTPFLQVKYSGKTLGRDALNTLIDAAEQVVELELSNLELPERFWEKIGAFKNLLKLKIDGTNTEDQNLEKLVELPLTSLNIGRTPVTTAGVRSLFGHPTLERLYAWNTKIAVREEEKLQEQTPIKLAFGVFEGFSKPQQLKPPQLTTEKTLFDSEIAVDFFSKIKGNVIRYTLDGSDPDSTSLRYEDPIKIGTSLTLKARSFKEGWLPSDVFTEDYFKVGKKIEKYQMLTRPSNRYSGVHKLFDFEEGSTNFADGNWLGFSGNDLEFTTKISTNESIENITVSCMESIGGWIIYPKSIRVYGRSGEDSFSEIGRYDYRPKKIPTETTKKSFTLPIKVEDYTEIKLVVKNIGTLPQWHPAAGNEAWLFVDEILFW
jgi:uncharacterized membrane protein